MVTELNVQPAGLDTMPWTDHERGLRSASNGRRLLDCAAMAQMSLPTLLYYVLVGDGKLNPFV